MRNLMLKPTSMDTMMPSIEQICDDFCEHIADMRDKENYVHNLPQHIYRLSFEGRDKVYPI